MNAVDPEQEMRKRIMFRVKAIYFLRKFSTPLAIEGVLFVVLSTAISFSISIPHIIANVYQLSYVTESFGYIYGATLHTKHIVQIILAAGIVLVVLIVRDIYKNIWTTREENVEVEAQTA